jgi:hypothetical protein
MYTESDSTSSDRSEVPTSQSNYQRISARELHGYVWGIMTVFIAFAISYPIACWRVSQSEQFRIDRSHVKSVTILTSTSARN